MSGCPALASNPPALTSPKESGQCIVWWDVHVDKTGGSTVRSVMKRLEEHGECAYVGFAPSTHFGQELLRALHNTTTAHTPGPRLCVEIHQGPLFAGRSSQGRRWTDELGRLQSSVPQCRILRSTRVREPLSMYVSMYTWAVNRTHLRHPGLAANLGDDFLAFVAAVPNLMSSILLHGNDAVKEALLRGRASQEPDESPGSASLRSPFRFLIPATDSAAWRAELTRLVDSFDVLSPLEELDASLVATADVLGLRAINFHRVDPLCSRAATFYPERVDLQDRRKCRALEALLERCLHSKKGCSADRAAACEAAAGRQAPLDRFVYELARERWARHRAGLGERFATQLERFRDASVGEWHGGPPPVPRCKFVRAGTARQADWQATGKRGQELAAPIFVVADNGSNVHEHLMPDFARHPCNPGPQALHETFADYRGKAYVVPNTPGCRSDPLSRGCGVYTKREWSDASRAREPDG